MWEAKLCVTAQRAILGGLLYLLTINEKFYKFSFLSQILAMVLFRLFSTYLTLPLLRRMLSPDRCNCYPPGLKLLLTLVARKTQTSSERSSRKCWNFPRLKSIVSSRWSFLPLQVKKRSKIAIQNNTYCSQIQVAFRDTFSLGFKKKRR